MSRCDKRQFNKMKKILLLLFLTVFSYLCQAQSNKYEFNCCTDVNHVISKSGTTKVAPLMFGAVAKYARTRIISEKTSTFKSFVLISYCWDCKRGKIWNITDDLHKYHVEYTDEDGDKYTEDVEVLPRTFSHMIPQYILQPIKVTVYGLQ